MGPDSLLLLKLRWAFACTVGKDHGASLETMIETTPLVEECVQTARRLLGDENPLTVHGQALLDEHLGNVALMKAKRVLERFISRFKAQRRARLSQSR